MPETFDQNDWIDRLSVALSTLIDSIDYPPFTWGKASAPAVRDIEEARRDDLQRYKELGALARTSAYASKLFSETTFPVRDTPQWGAVVNVILGHPAFEGSWFDRTMGRDAGPPRLGLLISSLAKLAVRRSSAHAATRLHRFLALASRTMLPGYEITLLHGLDVSGRVALGGKAYLAPFDAVRRRFGLEEDPEHWLTRGGSKPRSLSDEPSVSALVRRFSWGAGYDWGGDSDETRYLRYWHPDNHRIHDVVAKFHEQDLLVKILSVVMETKLVKHTVIVHLPNWMGSLDPNLGFDRVSSGSRLSDVWPQDVAPTAGQIDAYVSAAQGWLVHYSKTKPFKLDLAIDRMVASYGVASGDFGFADPIVDVSIALEAMYGPFKPKTIVESLSKRAGWVLGGTRGKRNKIARAVKSFYEESRSNIVHAVDELAYHERELLDQLDAGRGIARSSVLAMLEDNLLADDVAEWDGRLSRGNRPVSHKRSSSLRN